MTRTSHLAGIGLIASDPHAAHPNRRQTIIKAVAATLILAALLLTGLAATFGFWPFAHQNGTDRVTTRTATELAASKVARPAALPSSALQATPADTMAAPAADGAVKQAWSVSRKPAQFALSSKRRAHRFDSAPAAAVIDVASTIDTAAVVEPPEANPATPDRVAAQEPVSQHAEMTVSKLGSPTELHPLSDKELAALSAANKAMVFDAEQPSPESFGG